MLADLPYGCKTVVVVISQNINMILTFYISNKKLMHSYLKTALLPVVYC